MDGVGGYSKAVRARRLSSSETALVVFPFVYPFYPNFIYNFNNNNCIR
jgi:hypothetical protein